MKTEEIKKQISEYKRFYDIGFTNLYCKRGGVTHPSLDLGFRYINERGQKIFHTVYFIEISLN